MPLLGSIDESQSIYNAPKQFHSENIGHDFNLQNTSTPIVIFRSFSTVRAEEEAKNAEM